MDADRIAEERIREAQRRGELTPTVGVGEPFGRMDDDPDWWVRALLERERIPEERAELISWIDAHLADAATTPDLGTARRLLARVNHRIDRWNDGVGDGDRIDAYSEIWLLDERAKRRH